MSLACVGISHRTAVVAVRERLAYGKDEVGGAVARLRRSPGIAEAMILSTCNRFEAYAVLGGATGSAEARRRILRFLTRDRRVSSRTLARAAYVHAGAEAARHLMEVAAGLDSQVVGEAQIIGQVRDAHAAALAAGATGAVLNGMVNRGLAAAKRVRTETEIGRLPASVSSVAVDLAERIFGDLSAATVLLLGTGETSVLVAEGLTDAGAPRLLIAGERHHDRAKALAARHRGRALELAEARARLAEADVVVAATAAREPVILREHVAAALRTRRAKPVFLIDLGMPRNVDAGIAELPNAYLYNLDDLKAVADENVKRRAHWIEPARRILDAEVAATGAWLESLEAVPVIRELQAFGEDARRAVLARAGRRVRELPPETREEVEYLTKALVAKLLHGPISRVKELAADNGTARYPDLLRRLFGLK